MVLRGNTQCKKLAITFIQLRWNNSSSPGNPIKPQLHTCDLKAADVLVCGPDLGLHIHTAGLRHKKKTTLEKKKIVFVQTTNTQRRKSRKSKDLLCSNVQVRVMHCGQRLKVLFRVDTIFYLLQSHAWPLGKQSCVAIPGYVTSHSTATHL